MHDLEHKQQKLTALEKGIIGLFSDGVKLIGLPKSVGEIYGLLYARNADLSLDDLGKPISFTPSLNKPIIPVSSAESFCCLCSKSFM